MRRQDSVIGYMLKLFSMSCKLQLLHFIGGGSVAIGAMIHLPEGSLQSQVPIMGNKNRGVIDNSTYTYETVNVTL